MDGSKAYVALPLWVHPADSFIASKFERSEFLGASARVRESRNRLGMARLWNANATESASGPNFRFALVAENHQGRPTTTHRASRSVLGVEVIGPFTQASFSELSVLASNDAAASRVRSQRACSGLRTTITPTNGFAGFQHTVLVQGLDRSHSLTLPCHLERVTAEQPSCGARSRFSYVAKTEAGDLGVTVDPLVQGLLAAGVSRKEIAKALANSVRKTVS